MGKNTIKIDGKKLRKIIEDKGLNLYAMPVKYGFSKNLVQGAIAKNEASIVVQNLLSYFNIEKEAYMIREEEEEQPTAFVKSDFRLLATLTADDLREIIREELKAIIGGIKP